MARKLLYKNVGGQRVMAVDRGQRRMILDAACACCGTAYVRPRLCDSDKLSGETGAADETTPIGIRVTALDAAGSFFCYGGRCYYVPDPPDYWDFSLIAGIDFHVVSGTDFDHTLPFYAGCDDCGCLRILGAPAAWTYSRDTVASVDANFGYTEGGGGTAPHLVTYVASGDLASSVSRDDPDLPPACGETINWWGVLSTTITSPGLPTVTEDRAWSVTAGNFASIGGGNPGWVIAVYPHGLTSPGGSPEASVVTGLGTCAGGTADTETIPGGGEASVSITGNTCPCDAAFKLFRKWRAVWKCAAGEWRTAKPELVWQRCLPGHVTYDWPDDADVQCVLDTAGGLIKTFEMVEEVGDCPATLPAYPSGFADADYPDFPTPDPTCTDCPAGPKCLWRFYAKYTPGGATWATFGTPDPIGCRRTKDFPTWTYHHEDVDTKCIFAIDVFGDDCNDASDCGTTPPTAPDLPADGTTATSLGASRCDDIVGCVTACPETCATTLSGTVVVSGFTDGADACSLLNVTVAVTNGGSGCILQGCLDEDCVYPTIVYCDPDTQATIIEVQSPQCGGITMQFAGPCWTADGPGLGAYTFVGFTVGGCFCTATGSATFT